MTDTTPRSSHRNDESLGALFADASRDLSELVRSEIELAKVEIKLSVKNVVAGGAMFGAAAVLAALALILLLISAAYGLVAAGLDPSIAFLVVAAALLAIAGVLGFVGMRAIAKLGPPERTIRTSKHTAAFLKSPRSGNAQTPSS
jgi:uncharacterized membrane protein YqjE